MAVAIDWQSWPRRWVDAFTDAVSSLGGFLALHRRAGEVRYLEDEVRSLVAPSLPLLIHKRSKILAAPGGAAQARWRTELEFFVDRILWPMLGIASDPEGRVRARIADHVDTLVTVEHAKAASLPCSPQPIAWRAGWAS